MTENNNPVNPLLCMVLGDTFSASLFEYHLDPYDFISKVMLSSVFEHFTEDYTIYSQSPLYIVEKLMDEWEYKKDSIQKLNDYDYDLFSKNSSYWKESLYWFGYFLLYWKESKHLDGSKMLQYDWENVFESANVLHTQDLDYVVNLMDEIYDQKHIKEMEDIVAS